MSILNTSLSAYTANRLLNKHYKELEDSVAKLSSGKRINKSADDPAGMAVSELMKSDVAAYRQGARNTNDAVSLLQTADGATDEIGGLLVRMKELAEQAATGTYQEEQRAVMDSEYQQLASEITRIAESTEFNGRKLLNGESEQPYDGSAPQSTGMIKVHFGSGNEVHDSFYIKIGSLTASSLGVGNNSEQGAGFAISTQESAASALQALEEAIVSKNNVRASIGMSQNRLESTLAHTDIQADNLQSAESRITDVDAASEMTRFLKQQMLTESAVSMLSQANGLQGLLSQLVSD